MINITDTSFFNFLGFKERITIDGKNHIVYHLDKTRLFFPIKLISLPYDDVKVIVSTSGNCSQMKLNCECTHLDTPARRHLHDGMEQQDRIKQFVCGHVSNYNSDNVCYIEMTNTINGFILTDIDHRIINSICFKLNQSVRLSYEDKLDIRLNTTVINENTIYIYLNNSSYSDDVNGASLRTSRIENMTLSLGLDEGHSNINFKIGCYSNNLLSFRNGICVPRYLYSNDITTGLTWQRQEKKLEGNEECPVLLQQITGDYVSCSQCENNFDACIINSWFSKNRTCPMCRTHWTNNVRYQQLPTLE